MFKPDIDIEDLPERPAPPPNAAFRGEGVTYHGLVEKLAAIGVVDSEPNIRNKLARGNSRRCFWSNV